MAAEADTAAVRERYLAAVAAAHTAETEARARHPHTLSVSRLAGCTRQAAYALAGTPVTEPPKQVEARAANHGTWLHEGLLPRLADQVGGKHETIVVVRAAGVTIMGRADLAVVESAAGGELADVKTVNGLDAVRRAGGFGEHWVQLMAYILGERQRSRPVRWAVLIYVDRATGEAEVFVRPVTDEALLAVVERIGEIVRLAAAPQTAPRVTAALPGGRRWRMRGPGPKGYSCNECDWLRACWGPDAKPGQRGAQRNLVRTDPAREAALGAYVTASSTAADAAAEKEFWRSVLDGSPAGLYGSWRLSWTRAGAISVKAIGPVEEG